MNTNSLVTSNEWLKKASEKLDKVGIGTARLDCLVLLEDTTAKDRAWLLAHPEYVLSGSVLKRLDTKLRQRLQHVPLAYIRGKTEFYGREFMLTHDVLEPRPESEAMIDLLKGLRTKSREPSIIDVGCGSGALGITAALELPDCQVTLIDIDPKCLRVAHKNAEEYKVDVTLVEGDLLQPLSTLNPVPWTLLCNLPYVPDSYQLNNAAMMEPRIAIFGGPDGLDLYRKLFQQLEKRSATYVLTESLPFQHKALAVIAQNHGYQQQTEDDFIQVFTKANS